MNFKGKKSMIGTQQSRITYNTFATKPIMIGAKQQPELQELPIQIVKEDDAGLPSFYPIPLTPSYVCLDPALLQRKYRAILPRLIEKPNDKKKHKGTNIPKFLLKVFFNNLPEFPDKQHLDRLLSFIQRPQKSKTRFHLVELFGTGETERESQENQLNRRVLKRLLVRNYDNILINKHIRNKRLYLLFCKKMLLRLNRPELIDRLEI